MSSLQYKLKPQEKLILFLERSKKAISRVQELGKTRLSLLLIPHSQEKIYKIELSINLLFFLGLTAAFILLASFYYSLKYISFPENHRELYESSSRNRLYFIHQDMMIDEMDDTVDILIKKTRRLHRTIWKQSSALDYFSLNWRDWIPNSIFSEKQEELSSNMQIYRSTVKKVRKLSQRLKQLKPGFENAIEFLETREGIYQSMPQGRPLAPGVGFITSLFGKRNDPFGLGEGEFHSGIDFASSYRTPIYATGPGIIAELRETPGGLGRSVRINHGNGIYTLYGHCYEFKVREGQKVKRGQLIALMGATGKATGSHVHYEVHIGSEPSMDPREFINLE
ncbi:MAG: M23 family metallopeptidase [Leptospiraceae bacterium]|nr:M23 family metallopeptidase [Leptospiraceae bacterium]MCP5499568.1 M23 family metallopeptidase [Leptospiraceae bacterium]